MKSNRNLFIFLSLTLLSFVKALTGGELAKTGEFPHAVQLSFAETGEFFCGGSILSSTVILTAAHCLHYIGNLFTLKMPATEIKVTAGKLSLRGENKTKSNQEQIREVARYVVHPECNLILGNHDVALLLLTNPLDFTENVKPIQLPTSDVTYSRGMLAGWGYTDGRNLSSDWLQKVDFELEEKIKCDQEALLGHSSFHVTGTELCSKRDAGAGLCKGDSGSGLVCQRNVSLDLTRHFETNGVDASFPVICGIASWSRASGICGEQKNGSVFLDVSKYLNWIHYEIKKEKVENSKEICSLEDNENNQIELKVVAKVENNKLLMELKKIHRKMWCSLYSILVNLIVSIFISAYYSTYFNENNSILAFQLLLVFTFSLLSVVTGKLVDWID